MKTRSKVLPNCMWEDMVKRHIVEISIATM